VREVVLEVPDQVGQIDQHGQHAAEPEPARPEGPPLGREDQPHDDGGAEEGHGVLVEHAEAGHDAEEKPAPVPPVAHDADHDPRGAGPEELLQGVHGVDAVQRQPDGGRQHGERRDALGETAAAEVAGHEPGHQHQGGAGEGREKPDGEERVAEHRADQRRHGGEERRHVHEPPSQVFAGGEEVELVDEEAVAEAPGRGEVERQLGEGQEGDDAEPGGQDAAVRGVAGRGSRRGSKGKRGVHDRDLV
jgi:hypothetical protein